MSDVFTYSFGAGIEVPKKACVSDCAEFFYLSANSVKKVSLDIRAAIKEAKMLLNAV